MYKLFPVLKEASKRLAGTLGGGEQQMLAIARELMSRPKILMLDEPSLGLAPRVLTQLFDIIQEIHNSGISILLVEQNVHTKLNICERAYVLETGTNIFEGTGKELAGNSYVKKACLGVT